MADMSHLDSPFRDAAERYGDGDLTFDELTRVAVATLRRPVAHMTSMGADDYDYPQVHTVHELTVAKADGLITEAELRRINATLLANFHPQR